MCKVGILLISLDLYHSASALFSNLIIHKTGSPLDLGAHILALLTLLLAYRGRVRRNVAGKVVLPVMMVNLIKQLIAGGFVTFLTNTDVVESSNAKMVEWSFFDNQSATGYDRLMVLKSMLFCGVMGRLAFQGVDTCVGENEWFPWHRGGVCEEIGEKEEEEVKKD